MLHRLNQLEKQIGPNGMAVVFDDAFDDIQNTPDIHLYTEQTPNGIKISITLEELG